MTDQPFAICLHEADNVLVALRAVPAGTGLPGGITAREPIPAGHKIALRDVAAGESILKYGQIIGTTTAAIPAGAHVHVQNLGMGAHKQDYAFGTAAKPLPAAETEAEFLGFHRPSGRVGTRNYLGILTSVNCAGSVARFIAEAAQRADLLAEFPNVDGIVPIVHGSGCGMSGKGEGYDTLFRTLAGYGHSANFGAILMVASDVVCRNAPASWNLRLGVVTAVAGAPYFLYLLTRQRRGMAL